MKRRTFLRALGAALLLPKLNATAQVAAPQPGPAGPWLVKTPTPADAVRLAAAHLSSLPEADWPFKRYFYTSDNSPEFHGAFNYVLNTVVSHASTLYLPAIVGNGHLICMDIRRVWPRAADAERLFVLYEELALIDPYFHVQGTITKEQEVRVPVPPYRAVDGKTYDYKFETKTVTTHAADPALHLAGLDGDMTSLTDLSSATASGVPILRADWFMVTCCTSNADENGRYYQFRRISPGAGGKSAEQLWLEAQGVDYERVKAVIRSDQRIGKWRSNITGKPRAIEYFYAGNTRPAVGPIVTTITRDFFNGRIDPKRHPIKNLLNYVHDGTEAISALPNGMLVFVLFDAAGNLVEVAPDKLVSDRTVPAPHPSNLQPPISCIRCHGPTDMWMDANNDVMALTKGQFGTNIFDDESDAKLTPEEAVDRLAGLYTGELAEPLRISRNTHAKATFVVTGGMEIPAVAQKIAEVYAAYRYDPVTPQVACADLGYAVPAERAAEVFGKIVPLMPPNRHGASPENPTVATLRAWTEKNLLHVNRGDWEQEFADTMLRVTTEEVRALKLGEKTQP